MTDERLNDDVTLAEVAAFARKEIAKELARRRRFSRSRGCSTCGTWWDVIHAEFDGRLEHDWEPHGGKCPMCGRGPRVFTVTLSY